MNNLSFVITGAYFVEFALLFFVLVWLIACLLNSDARQNWADPRLTEGIVLSSIVMLLLCMYLTYDIEYFWVTNYEQPFYPTSYLYLDETIVSFKMAILFLVLMCQLLALGFFRAERLAVFEYTFLIMLTTIAMLILVSSVNLFVSYLALEIQSLLIYILVAIKRYSNLSVEAAVKYYLFGSFGSGLLLLGMSLIYYSMGTLNFYELSDLLQGVANESIYTNYFNVLSVILILVGICIKLGVVPFHFWIGDVYEGSPSLVTCFFSTATKLPILIFLLKVLYIPFYSLLPTVGIIVLCIGVLSVIIGIGLTSYETEIRRFMAYSSLPHMGFLLICLAMNNVNALEAFFLYGFIYFLVILQFFACIIQIRILSQVQDKETYPEVLRWVVSSSSLLNLHYMLGFVISISFLGVAGLPPLMGFFSKLFVFVAIWQSGDYFMALGLILLSVLTMVYYIRMVRFLTFYFGKSYQTINTSLWLHPLGRLTVFIILLLFIVNLLIVVNIDVLLEIFSSMAQQIK